MGILKYLVLFLLSCNFAFAQEHLNDFQKEQSKTLNLPLVPLTTEGQALPTQGGDPQVINKRMETFQDLQQPIQTANPALCPARPKSFWEGAPVKALECNKTFIKPKIEEKDLINIFNYPVPPPSATNDLSNHDNFSDPIPSP
jgi:hypothetical protein